MTHSTLTDKFQTTIPREVRNALKLSPRQRIIYEVRNDGTAVMRSLPPLSSLVGSLKPKRPIASVREEKATARAAWGKAGSK